MLCVEQMKTRLRAHPVPIQLPIGAEDNFQGIVDLIKMKAFVHKDDLGKVIEEQDIPTEMQADAEKFRSEMIEAAAEQDEELMMNSKRYSTCYMWFFIQKQRCTRIIKCSCRFHAITIRYSSYQRCRHGRK